MCVRVSLKRISLYWVHNKGCFLPSFVSTATIGFLSIPKVEEGKKEHIFGGDGYRCLDRNKLDVECTNCHSK